MLAVILSAGVGRRLAPLTETIPKALIEVDGRPLIWHTLRALHRAGTRQAVLVVGHLQAKLREALAAGITGLTLHWVTNELYARTGSLYSLWLAREYLRGPFLFMDADLLFNPNIFNGLYREEDKSCLLVGSLAQDSGEEVKVAHRRGLATAIGKSLNTTDPIAGEAVGIVKIAGPDVPLAVALMAELIRQNPMAEHEELSQALCDRERLWVRDIGLLSWLEIDFPEDLHRAREVVWPAIQRETAG